MALKQRSNYLIYEHWTFNLVWLWAPDLMTLNLPARAYSCEHIQMSQAHKISISLQVFANKLQTLIVDRIYRCSCVRCVWLQGRYGEYYAECSANLNCLLRNLCISYFHFGNYRLRFLDLLRSQNIFTHENGITLSTCLRHNEAQSDPNRDQFGVIAQFNGFDAPSMDAQSCAKKNDNHLVR